MRSVALHNIEDKDPRPGSGRGQTRGFLKLRMAPVQRMWLAKTAGELLDRLTVTGMAAGLRERLPNQSRSP